MRRTRFDDAPCPIARVTDLVGDWWTPIVLRDLMYGITRFDELQARLSIPRATLAQRLSRLVTEGLLVEVPYQDRPVRNEYRLTAKGLAFFDVLAAMWRWGGDWCFGDSAPPVRLADRESGATIRPAVVDENTGKPIDVRAIRLRSNRAVTGDRA